MSGEKVTKTTAALALLDAVLAGAMIGCSRHVPKPGTPYHGKTVDAEARGTLFLYAGSCTAAELYRGIVEKAPEAARRARERDAEHEARMREGDRRLLEALARERAYEDLSYDELGKRLADRGWRNAKTVAQHVDSLSIGGHFGHRAISTREVRASDGKILTGKRHWDALEALIDGGYAEETERSYQEGTTRIRQRLVAVAVAPCPLAHVLGEPDPIQRPEWAAWVDEKLESGASTLTLVAERKRPRPRVALPDAAE